MTHDRQMDTPENQQIEHINLTHDPLCGLSEPCDDEIRDHGYCLMSHGQFCIHCNQWCICPQLQQAKEEVAKRIIEMADIQAEVAAAMASDDMLERCIAAVETVAHWTDSDMGLPLTDRVDEKWIAKGNAIAALRALQEKP